MLVAPMLLALGRRLRGAPARVLRSDDAAAPRAKLVELAQAEGDELGASAVAVPSNLSVAPSTPMFRRTQIPNQTEWR